ncbi:MAG TPA: hypothetical protein VHA73_13355 [Acidimicrobiales bacterium]|jgi:hypothetical protein|nr:hypothetical protein [Acidimicrobiales bacterium]
MPWKGWFRFVSGPLAVGLLVAGLAVAPATGAGATPSTVAASGGYAPLDQPGPALQVPQRDLDASLRCPANLSAVTRDVVLMIPGTTVDPDEAFAWNYEQALTAEHMPYCTVTVPNHTDGDIQVAAEYVVNAVRVIRSATHRKVILFGWSQGASTLPRWALRWWPDIRPMVASLVGLAPLNNKGSAVATGLCVPGSCIPAGWQQAIGSKFMAALNSRAQTFPGIAYTAIYTRVDDVVTPDVDGSLSVLPPGPNVTNVAIQDVCATDLSDHLLIPASPTAYAIALDAFRHPGEPADLARVRLQQPCLPGTMPHVSPIELLTQTARIAGNVGPRVMQGMVDAEPPLACYVTASCGAPTPLPVLG